jgi:hypothetical protein
MELENQTIEQVQAQDHVEPSQEVSTQEPSNEQPEWKPIESKEELNKLLKAEQNRTYTRALKELGVSSVKEFKELRAKVEQEKSYLETLTKERDEYAGKIKSLEAELNSLKQERVLDKLNVQEEYREDLVKLAMEKVTDEKPFEQVLKEMVEGKYKYTVANRLPIKMGIEKTEKVDQEPSVSDNLLKKYPWLKG